MQDKSACRHTKVTNTLQSLAIVMKIVWTDHLDNFPCAMAQILAMKPIPTEFPGRADQRGYLFKVIKRQGNVALLEKHNPAHKPGSKFYEVVIIRAEPIRTFADGRTIEAHERLPSPEEWGSHAWSLASLEDSLEKFRSQLT